MPGLPDAVVFTSSVQAAGVLVGEEAFQEVEGVLGEAEEVLEGVVPAATGKPL